MKILLVNPSFSDISLSNKDPLKLKPKKESFSPFGLLSILSMLPNKWQKEIIDLNIFSLYPQYLLWADYVIVSATFAQKKSVNKILRECRKYGVKIVAEGLLISEEFEKYNSIDHMILNESKINFPRFIKDLKAGHPNKIYSSS